MSFTPYPYQNSDSYVNASASNDISFTKVASLLLDRSIKRMSFPPFSNFLQYAPYDLNSSNPNRFHFQTPVSLSHQKTHIEKTKKESIAGKRVESRE